MSPLVRLMVSDDKLFPAEFPVWMEYDLTTSVKERSGLLAKAYSMGGVYVWDTTMFIVAVPQPVELLISPTLWTIYQENLVLFRMKWLEIQGVTKELRRYTIQKLKRTKGDKAFGHFRYVLVQTVWSTHIVDGTILIIYLDQTKCLVPDIFDVVKNRVKFKLLEPLDVKCIRKCTIVRGGERQSQIRQHLRQGMFILTDTCARRGGLMWCSQYFGLPQVVDQELSSYFAS